MGNEHGGRRPVQRLRIRFLMVLLAFSVPRLLLAGDIQQVLRDLNSMYGGRLGVMAKNLATGEVVAFQEQELFPTASTIKLPILAALYDRIGRNEIDPDESIVLRQTDIKPGSGVLQFLQPGAVITLRDAATLMITLSDNTATNLVLDHLGTGIEAQLEAVNGFLRSRGLRDTKLLNRLYSAATKQHTPEAMRYGIGVSTPEEMVSLLEQLYRGTLTDSASCAAMIALLGKQFYDDMIPRLLPESQGVSVAHKTGSINELKADVGIVFSKTATFAIAVFVDKHPDHVEGVENRAELLGAKVARAVWNHFTGMQGEDPPPVDASDVDWTFFPGGKWGIYRTTNGMFPHPDRAGGLRRADGTFYPYFPHYADSSVVVFVPEGFHETPDGSNVIVHFHGHMHDNINTLEQYGMPEAMISGHLNALLILPQGPYRARDSFGGKMEDPGGFRRLVEDVMGKMVSEKVVGSPGVARIIVSAHSGGYRPAGFVLDRGGLSDRITDVFLFDALYGQHDFFRAWLLNGHGVIRAAFTEHLAAEHASFAASVAEAGSRWSMTPTDVKHEDVVQTFFPRWIALLPSEWKMP
jgi:beta-lactamase class A